MDKIEQKLELMQEEIKYITEIGEKIEPYWMKYIEFHRDFVKNIILLSAGIIGFSIPIFGKAEIIKGQLLFIISLFAFIFVVIIGLIYLKILLTNDKKYIQKTLKFGIDIGKNAFQQAQVYEKLKEEHKPELEKEMLDSVLKSMNGFGNDIKQDLPFQKMYEWLLNIMFGLFIIGISLLALSLVNF